MAYQYDIFISYKRSAETNRWIEEHFEPLLGHAVELELGRNPKIYRDNQVLDGGTWPVELGMALGVTRVLVPLWTKTYFYSEWCSRELATMLAREQEMSCRTIANPCGLIIPAILHDYETPEPHLAHIQTRDLRRYFNPRMPRNGPRAEQLADALMAAAPGITRAIESAPSWQPSWPQTTADAFLQILWQQIPPRQTIVPGFSI